MASLKDRVADVGSQKQLFIDQHVVDEMVGVSQVLNPAVKHEANPLLVPEFPWEFAPTRDGGRNGSIQFYGTVLYDEEEKTFKMWYMAQGGVCYATSRDGLEWEKPRLGLAEFEGSKQNNIVPDGPYEGLNYCPEMRDVEGPERVYKCLRLMPGRCWMPFFSSDGLRWTQHPAEPVVQGGDECKTCKTHDALPGDWTGPLPKYAAFPKIGPSAGRFAGRRSVGLSLSDDYVNWSPPVLVLVADEVDDEMAPIRVAEAKEAEVIDLDWPEDYRGELYHMCVFPYEGLFLGLVDVFYIAAELWRIGQLNQGGPDEIQLTSSRDLIHWERAGGREPIVPNGRLGDWDAGWRSATSRPLVMGDEIWIYYGARNTDHGGLIWNNKPRTAGIGLAKLRLDGFVSLDAGDTEGTVTTRPLLFEGRKLVINARAGEGSVVVEVLSREGVPVDGFSAMDCDPFVGDSVRHTVTWRGDSDLSSLHGGPMRLRFRMKKVKLYAFAFVNDLG